MAKHIRRNVGKDGAISRKTASVVRNPDGSICIGRDCALIRVPPPNSREEIQVDVTGCDEDIQRTIDERIKKGIGAEFKFKIIGK